MTLEMLLALALGYLFGSIPFGLILTKLAGKGDIREIGSGNIGATNVLRTGNRWLAALTVVLDCLKATAAILIARTLFADPLNDLAERYSAAGALLGHLYPIWLKFRGGKGVATLLGILIGLWFPAGVLIYAVVWLGLLLTVRISSLAGMAAALSAPIVAYFFDEGDLVPMLAAFALLIIWKHRENIVRLRSGTEPRVGVKTK